MLEIICEVNSFSQLIYAMQLADLIKIYSVCFLFYLNKQQVSVLCVCFI